MSTAGAQADQIATIYRNTTGPLVVTVLWQNLAESSGLGNYTSLVFTAKRSLTDSDADAKIAKSLSSGITVTTAGNNTDTNGVLSVLIDASDTSDATKFPPRRTNLVLYYDVYGTDDNGKPWLLCKGLLVVAPHATQAT